MGSRHWRMALLSPKSHLGGNSGWSTSGGMSGVTAEELGGLRGHAGEEGKAAAGAGSPRLGSPHHRPVCPLGAAVQCLPILKHPSQLPSTCSPALTAGGAGMLSRFLRVLAASSARPGTRPPES